MVTIQIIDRGSDRYQLKADTKCLGRMYDSYAETITVIKPLKEATNVCTMIITRNGTVLDHITVGNEPVRITSNLSQYKDVKIGFTFTNQTGYVKNSDVENFYFAKAQMPEDFEPVDPERIAQIDELIGGAFLDCAYNSTDKTLDFSNLEGQIVVSVDMTPFIQDEKGTEVYVNGVFVETFNADTKANVGDSYTKTQSDAKYALETDMQTVQGNIETLSSGLEEAEQNIQELSNDVDTLGTTVTNLQQTVSTKADQSALTTEISARQSADANLQGQIDAISSRSDVVDVVGTYAELQAYDTSKLIDNDVIKVLADETMGGAISYYRWIVTAGVGAWSYIGSQGPFYTKSETDTLLNAKQNTLVSGTNIKTINGSSLLGSGNIDVETTQKEEIFTVGESGTLTQYQLNLVQNPLKNTIIVNNGERYYFVYDASTYMAFININSPTDTEITYKAIYVNTSSEAVNYGSWSKETISPQIPIATTISSSSTNTEVAGAKAVYDYVNEVVGDIDTILQGINNGQGV